MSTKSIGRSDLARLLGVTPRWISLLVEKGMPQIGRGRFAAGPALLWYCKFLQNRTKAGGLDTELARELREAKLRRVLAEAKLRELQLAEKRGGLIPVAIFEKRLVSEFQIVRSRFLNLPARLAPLLESQPRTAIRAVLDAEVRKILTQLSRSGEVEKAA